LRISKSSGSFLRAGIRTGSRLAGAQKTLEPTHVWLLPRNKTSGRSIECEFDHLFLVAAPFTIGHAFCGSQKAAEDFCAQEYAQAVDWLVRRKL
jgi:hypothetical protein